VNFERIGLGISRLDLAGVSSGKTGADVADKVGRARKVESAFDLDDAKARSKIVVQIIVADQAVAGGNGLFIDPNIREALEECICRGIARLNAGRVYPAEVVADQCRSRIAVRCKLRDLGLPDLAARPAEMMRVGILCYIFYLDNGLRDILDRPFAAFILSEKPAVIGIAVVLIAAIRLAPACRKRDARP
jgi:hypothetical protein